MLSLARAQAFDLFFQFEFLSLELSKSQLVRGRSLQFVPDCAIKIFVSETEFTNMRFNSHGVRLLAIGT